MKQEGIVAARDSDYYAVENSFIHLALQGRESLPITMAIIFVGIARRCGIAAAPVNYVNLRHWIVLTSVYSLVMSLWLFRPLLSFEVETYSMSMYSMEGLSIETQISLVPMGISSLQLRVRFDPGLSRR
jgi:hypothetical protein